MPVGEETHTRWDCQQQGHSEGKTGHTEHRPEGLQRKSKLGSARGKLQAPQQPSTGGPTGVRGRKISEEVKHKKFKF